jgi:hypothetical protein
MLLPRDNTTPQFKLDKVKVEGCYRCRKKDFEIEDNKLTCLNCGYLYWIEPDKSDGLYRSYTIPISHIEGEEVDASKWNAEKFNK